MAGGFNKFRWLLIPVLLGVTVFFLRWPGAAVPDGPDSPGEREMEFEPLSAKAVTVLGCGIDETGMLTDVIILGRFDLETDRISLLKSPGIPISGRVCHRQDQRGLRPSQGEMPQPS